MVKVPRLRPVRSERLDRMGETTTFHAYQTMPMSSIISDLRRHEFRVSRMRELRVRTTLASGSISGLSPAYGGIRPCLRNRCGCRSGSSMPPRTPMPVRVGPHRHRSRIGLSLGGSCTVAPIIQTPAWDLPSARAEVDRRIFIEAGPGNEHFYGGLISKTAACERWAPVRVAPRSQSCRVEGL